MYLSRFFRKVKSRSCGYQRWKILYKQTSSQRISQMCSRISCFHPIHQDTNFISLSCSRNSSQSFWRFCSASYMLITCHEKYSCVFSFVLCISFRSFHLQIKPISSPSCLYTWAVVDRGTISLYPNEAVCCRLCSVSQKSFPRLFRLSGLFGVAPVYCESLSCLFGFSWSPERRIVYDKLGQRILRLCLTTTHMPNVLSF